ncbi:hypothetical protein P9112_009884 [Eukaryota sp. TZLM1-RC]
MRFPSYKGSLLLDSEGNSLFFETNKWDTCESSLCPLVRVLHKFATDLTDHGDSITYFDSVMSPTSSEGTLILVSHQFHNSLGAVFFSNKDDMKKASLLVNSLFQRVEKAEMSQKSP